MEAIVPLISGGQTGPLGITHLPRFWLKMRAYAAGRLPEGYRHGNGGSDENLLTTFGIDADAFAAFIASDAPDYPATEAWIRANATDVSLETIRAFNEFLLSFDMPDPRLSEWTARFGLPHANYKAVLLNQLDDWDGMHRLLLAGASTAPLVPLIGTEVAGPLGVWHLPRLWLKHRLHGAGRLAEGYRHGVGGFDEVLTTKLGVDGAAFARFVETETPDYLTAEAWVRANATTCNAETIAATNAHMLATKMPAENAAKRRAELGPAADGIELGIPLNNLDDWGGAHRYLKAVAV